MQIEMYDLPDADVTLTMQCEDCNHIQVVKGIRRGGEYYFGSAYSWCNECDTGLPIVIEAVKVVPCTTEFGN